MNTDRHRDNYDHFSQVAKMVELDAGNEREILHDCNFKRVESEAVKTKQVVICADLKWSNLTTLETEG